MMMYIKHELESVSPNSYLCKGFYDKENFQNRTQILPTFNQAKKKKRTFKFFNFHSNQDIWNDLGFSDDLMLFSSPNT